MQPTSRTRLICNQAIDAGATSLMEAGRHVLGRPLAWSRTRSVTWWTIATHIEDVSPEEMQKRSEEWAAQMAGAQA